MNNHIKSLANGDFEVQPLLTAEFLIQRINRHLSSGGLVNPELANHSRVTDLLIDIRDYLHKENHEKTTRSNRSDQ